MLFVLICNKDLHVKILCLINYIYVYIYTGSSLATAEK